MEPQYTLVDNYLNTIHIEQLIEERYQQLLSEGMNIDKLYSSAKKNIVTMNKWFKERKYNVDKVIDGLKGYLAPFQKIIMKGYEKSEDIKSVTAKLDSLIRKIIKKILITVKKVIEEWKSDSALSKLLKVYAGLTSIMVVAALNGFFSMLGRKIGGPLGWVFDAIISGPVVEEAAKALAIKMDAPFIITGMWAGMEAAMYIKSYIKLGVAPTKAFTLRLVGFLFHMASTMMQKFFREKWEGTKYEKWMTLTGFFIAVAVHAIWNNTNLIPGTSVYL